MRQLNRGTSMVGVILVLAVVAVAGIGTFAYVASREQVSPIASVSSMTTTSIVGNSLAETVMITNNTEIDLICNSCILKFSVYSGVIIDMNIVGNYNQVTINGGSTNLSGTGNDNTVYLQNTKVLSSDLTGNGNSAQT